MPRETGVELGRLVQRWGQLPLEQASAYAGRVRALVQHLADEVSVVSGRAAAPVPDLGPAVLMDQLTVMVHDATMVHDAADTGPVPDLAQRLADLRRELR